MPGSEGGIKKGKGKIGNLKDKERMEGKKKRKEFRTCVCIYIYIYILYTFIRLIYNVRFTNRFNTNLYNTSVQLPDHELDHAFCRHRGDRRALIFIHDVD